MKIVVTVDPRRCVANQTCLRPTRCHYQPSQ